MISMWVSFLFLGFALSADACSVSLVYGAGFKPFRWRDAMIPAASFGIAQGVMPTIGWFGGELVAQLIESVDHWVAFGILLVVGAKFIYDSFQDEAIETKNILKPWTILLAAFATSIDACAVGFSLSLEDQPIALAAVIIALTTFVCSLICCRIGFKLGEKFGRKLLFLGGIVLIGIGVKILLGHLL